MTAHDRKTIDSWDAAGVVGPSGRGEDQRRAEEATWSTLTELEGALADPGTYVCSGRWEAAGVAIGAVDSTPRAWRWSIRWVVEPLAEIASAAWPLREVTDRLPALVAAARADGATWAQVGAAHAISRQGAQQRYDQGEAADNC